MNDQQSAQEPAVEVSHVSKIYESGKVHALEDVSFAINRREWVALTGPSGSGKSTLLHLIAALDEPTSGEIRVNGKALPGLPSIDRYRRLEVGLVFQLHNLLPNLTALQNVQIATIGTGVSNKESKKRALGLLEGVGLAERVNLRPPELSGGERQRVAIARALANNPTLLLADEPTGSLDPEAALGIIELFRRIREESQLTILLVTHDMNVAAAADRVIHMRKGRITSEDHGAEWLRPGTAARS
ncbi:MAG: ABC transporter ATP-binding protein [Dehalococcoidia bacterium]|nr:ABC transporter ATP-binding protein [Dehalococcoidia bacterium]